MADTENELSHDEKIARIKEIVVYLDWVRQQEKLWRGQRFSLGEQIVEKTLPNGGRTTNVYKLDLVMLFSGNVDDAIDWLTRQMAAQESKRRLTRCDCPKCKEIPDEQT